MESRLTESLSASGHLQQELSLCKSDKVCLNVGLTMGHDVANPPMCTECLQLHTAVCSGISVMLL